MNSFVYLRSSRPFPTFYWNWKIGQGDAINFSKYNRLNVASGGEHDGPKVLHLNIFVEDIGEVTGGKVVADYTKMPEIPSNHFPSVVGKNVQFSTPSEILPTAKEIFRVTQPNGTISISFSSQYDAVEAALKEAGFVNVVRSGRTAPHGVIFTAEKPQ